jgi:hypothetical protein
MWASTLNLHTSKHRQPIKVRYGLKVRAVNCKTFKMKQLFEFGRNDPEQGACQFKMAKPAKPPYLGRKGSESLAIEL